MVILIQTNAINDRNAINAGKAMNISVLSINYKYIYLLPFIFKNNCIRR
ncbi:hypothetical protein MTBBW1_1420010 [Desulfamplus magnetovallimortis]|uniref:Uncharacterized protein n=1 Tax=Desulfamplus magnetovallimortis TaxID=1246637 RepID=A0A1W1H827_9BACT|nr:hypothetical protein MTBBW1_1420010 [Desulfamplus magnetovallimortis]